MGYEILVHRKPAETVTRDQVSNGKKRSAVSSTRYYRLVRPVFFYCISVFLVFLLLEVGSFTALSISEMVEEKMPYSEAFSSSWNRHPWYGATKETVVNFFHPITQIRGKAGVRWKTLETNEYGFIHNGHAVSLLNSFPQKPEGLLRIVVLGGSSAAGITASRNEHTIPAILEMLLNDRWEESGVAIQVLNYGIPGQYLFGELTVLASEVVHLSPDLVITFDGYNDASYVVEEHEIQGLELPLMNWADFSYWSFDQLNSYGVKVEPPPPPVFTYTFLLLKKMLRPDTELGRWAPERISDSARQLAYHDLVSFRLSEWNHRQYRYHENALKANLDSIAALLAQRKIPYLGYLQPHPLEFKDTTADELAGKKLFSNGPIHSKRISAMQVFSDIYRELDREYLGNTEVRFHDLRNLFEDIKRSIYNDSIHYNKYGNRLISERMMSDISVKDGRIYLSDVVDSHADKESGGEVLSRSKASVAFQGSDELVTSDREMPVEVRRSLERLKSQKSCPSCNLSNTDLTGLDLHQVNLSGGDLRNVTLSHAGRCNGCIPGEYMDKANLSGVNLRGAALAQVSLVRADLNNSDLRGADLRWANLTGANLVSAVLDKANLARANLRGVAFELTSFNETNFSGANLRKTDLSGLNLIGLDMSFADLTGSNLERTNLQGSNMTGVYVNRADLSGANLVGANLTRANLIEANLAGANLVRVNLKDADLYNGNFRGANLSGANLVGAEMSRSDFSNANLSKANLSKATLRWINLRGANLKEANLSETNLTTADLTGVALAGVNLTASNLQSRDLSSMDLRSAKLREANLRNIDLRHAILDKADLRWVDLKSADLSEAQLVEANLTGASLTDANLSGANFHRARLVGTTMVGANVQGIDLSNADLSDANLTEVDFSGAMLAGVRLTGANLHETTLTGANLKSADLSGLNLSGLNLQETNLSGAKLVGVNLNDADLTGANLSNTDMQNTRLENTIYCQTVMPNGSENNSGCSM